MRRIAFASAAIAAAFSLGSLAGPVASTSAPSKCKNVSMAQRTEWKDDRAPRAGVWSEARTVTATTIRCGSKYATGITFGEWNHLSPVEVRDPLHGR